MADASCILSDKYLADHLKTISYKVYVCTVEEEASLPMYPLAREAAEEEDLLSQRVGPPSPKRREAPIKGDQRLATIRHAEILLRKLIALGKCDLYTASSSSGLELWVYKMNSDDDFVVHDNELSEYMQSELRIVNESKHTVPFTYSLKDNPNTTTNGPYGPIQRSIANKSFDTLIMREQRLTGTDMKGADIGLGGQGLNKTFDKYEYLGENAVLDTYNGSLIRLQPYLQINGTLYLRMIIQKCRLRSAMPHFLPLPGTVLNLVPFGSTAKVSHWNHHSDVLFKPRLAYIQEFFLTLSENYITSTSIENLISCWWVKLIGNDSRSFIWPISLVYGTPQQCSNQQPQILYETHSHALYSNLEDPYTKVATEIENMARISDSDTNTASDGESDGASDTETTNMETTNMETTNTETGNNGGSNTGDESSKIMKRLAALERKVHPPMPPPPSPCIPPSLNNSLRLNAGTYNYHPTPTSSFESPSYSPGRRDLYDIHELYELSDQRNPYKLFVEPTETKDVAASNGMTNEMSGMEISEALETIEPIEHVGPTEIEPSTFSRQFWNQESDTEDNRPSLESSRNTGLKRNDQGTILKAQQQRQNRQQLQSQTQHQPQTQMQSQSQTQEQEQEQGQEQQEPLSTASTVNSGFSMESMDSKYSTGGRFFAHVSPEPESPKDADTDRRPSLLFSVTPDASKLTTNLLLSARSESSDGSDLTNDSESDEEGSVRRSVDSLAKRSKSYMMSPDIADSPDELNALNYLEPHPYVKPQCNPIKVDLDNFNLLIPQILFDRDLLTCLSDDVFNTAPLCTPEDSLLDLLKPAFPFMCPAELNPDQTLNSRPKLQFLNPPLVSVLIGEERMRARITILRFWQLLHLKPEPTQRTDLTVVLMTVDLPLVREECRDFLSNLKRSYENSNFGKMELLQTGDPVDGFYPVTVEGTTAYAGTLSDCFEKASISLYIFLRSKRMYASKNLLVISCYPSSLHLHSLPPYQVPNQLARSFKAIKNEFEKAQWMLLDLNALISDTGVMFSDYEYGLLALLAYSRFHQLSDLCSVTGLIPQTMGFQYKSAPTKYLLDEEPVLHVAYLIKNRKYVLMAVTDQWSKRQHIDVFKIDTDDDPEGKQQQDVNPGYLYERSTYTSSNQFPAGATDTDSNTAIPSESKAYVETAIGEIFKRAAKAGPDHRLVFSKCGIMEHEERITWSHFYDKHKSVSFHVIDIPYARGIRVNCKTAIKFREEDPKAIIPTDRHGRLMNSICINEDEEIHGVSINGPEGALASGVLMQLIRNSTDYYMFEMRLLLQCGLNIAPRSSVNRILGQLRRLASLSEVTGVSTHPTIVPWHILALAKLESAIDRLNMF